MATIIDQPDQIEGYRIRVIRRAIKLWLDTGLRANRAYTPTNMAYAAGQITGKQYKSGKKFLRQAYEDLSALIGEPA